MDIMEDLQERLNETERRAIEVVRRLEELDALQQSLANAGRGLGEASDNVSALAAATRTAIESLNSTLITFREAVEVFQRSDPGLVREKLAGIEEELGRITEKLLILDELSPEIRSTRNAVERLSQRSIFNQIFGGTRKAE